ncbi:MAG: helix-turn-helix domain-containing protein [Candidatus Anstonellaceae archaeon]
MECESCGKKIERTNAYLVLIEGAKLYVCKDCSVFGKILSFPSSPQKTKIKEVIAKSDDEYELVEGYGNKIFQARQRLKIPLNVLAERLSQKESFLDRIEKEKTIPPIDLVKKIEKELGIELLSSSSPISPSQVQKNSNFGSLTLGDILEIEKKKKK